MYTQLQQQIHDTIKQIVHIERVLEQLEVTNKELDDAISNHNKVEKKLRKELKDIERLEGLSTKAIFYKILGSKKKQLEKERQDYLELSLKEEDLQNSIKLLEYEVNLLDAKVSSRKGLEKKLEKLKRAREKEIIHSDPSLRKKLLKISNDLEDRFHFKNELDEALEVGVLCLNLTQQIVKLLSKVRNWGQWSGRQGHPSQSRMRRDALDRARNLTYQIKHHLNLFEKELSDIGKHIPFDTDTSQFTQFSDFFFRNLITDWIMQQQLTKAVGSAKQLFQNLKESVNELKGIKDRTESEIVVLNKDRDNILEA